MPTPEHAPDRTNSADAWRHVMRRAAGRFFIVQAAAGALWWILLFTHEPSRTWFMPRAMTEDLTAALAWPDIVLYVLGSAWAAFAARTNQTHAVIAASIATGAAAYAALFCWGLSLRFNDGWLGTTIMSASTVMGIKCILLLTVPDKIRIAFRSTRTKHQSSLAIQTFLQSAAFWLTFLVVLPWGLVALERTTDIPALGLPDSRHIIAVIVFVLGGTLGVSSSWVMVRHGKGTPLPSAAANQLVLVGPYRVLRNPMAVAGLIQGIAVAIWAASGVVIIYVILGGLVWDALVRPVEEHDLAERFGDDFDTYRANVRCWIPVRKR